MSKENKAENAKVKSSFRLDIDFNDDDQAKADTKKRRILARFCRYYSLPVFDQAGNLTASNAELKAAVEKKIRDFILEGANAQSINDAVQVAQQAARSALDLED